MVKAVDSWRIDFLDGTDSWSSGSSSSCAEFPINDLPNSALSRVFSLVPFAERHNCVPLVCQHWADVSRAGVWHDVDFAVRKEKAISAQLGSSMHVSDYLRPFARWLDSKQGKETGSFRCAPGEFLQEYKQVQDPAEEAEGDQWLEALLSRLSDKLVALQLDLLGAWGRKSILVEVTRFSALEKLSLSHLREVEDSAAVDGLAQLVNLRSLELSFTLGGSIGSCLPDAWSVLTKLTCLAVVNNANSDFQLPAWLSSLPELVFFECRPYACSGNKFPAELGSCTRLQHLSIRFQDWDNMMFSKALLGQSVHGDKDQQDYAYTQVANLTSLGYLNLSRNHFLHIADSINVLSRVDRLDLSENCTSPPNFLQLPSSMAGLRNLRELSLRRNVFKSSQSLRSLTTIPKLEVLDLSDCCLRGLPSEFGRFRSLKEINLDRNKFAVVPSCLLLLFTLEVVSMADNRELVFDEYSLKLCQLPRFQSFNADQTFKMSATLEWSLTSCLFLSKMMAIAARRDVDLSLEFSPGQKLRVLGDKRCCVFEGPATEFTEALQAVQEFAQRHKKQYKDVMQRVTNAALVF